eukprot:761633-Pyramimonas_sp.AAC.2
MSPPTARAVHHGCHAVTHPTQHARLRQRRPFGTLPVIRRRSNSKRVLWNTHHAPSPDYLRAVRCAAIRQSSPGPAGAPGDQNAYTVEESEANHDTHTGESNTTLRHGPTAITTYNRPPTCASHLPNVAGQRPKWRRPSLRITRARLRPHARGRCASTLRESTRESMTPGQLLVVVASTWYRQPCVCAFSRSPIWTASP